MIINEKMDPKKMHFLVIHINNFRLATEHPIDF